jgi:hypothetical protein
LVKSGPDGLENRLPIFPEQRTSNVGAVTSEKCQPTSTANSLDIRDRSATRPNLPNLDWHARVATLAFLGCFGGILKRRDFMTLVTGLVAAVPLASHAQHTPKRLAIFNPSEANAVLRPETDQRYFKAFFDELRRLGYVENQNLIVEPFGREQNTSGPEALAAEIVRGKPDLVYAVGPGAALFKEYTTTIPIVA